MAYIEVKMNTSVTKWERQLLLRMTAFLLKWKRRSSGYFRPRGAGKSTVLNILGGMDSCDEGEIIIDGTDIAQFSEKQLTTYRRNDVGFVFQFYNLVPNLTAKENVELASQIVADALDSTNVLQSVGLGERLDNFPAQLSGGEQQRVTIARAIAKSQSYFYVMNRQERWIMKQGNKF